MVKYLRISSYIRKPFLIYDFAQTQFEFPHIGGKFSFLFYQCNHEAKDRILGCSLTYKYVSYTGNQQDEKF
jgi:hypothetical protein